MSPPLSPAHSSAHAATPAFEDSSRLRILNVGYSLPAHAPSAADDVHVRLVRACLRLDPRDRPSMTSVHDSLLDAPPPPSPPSPSASVPPLAPPLPLLLNLSLSNEGEGEGEERPSAAARRQEPAPSLDQLLVLQEEEEAAREAVLQPQRLATSTNDVQEEESVGARAPRYARSFFHELRPTTAATATAPATAAADDVFADLLQGFAAACPQQQQQQRTLAQMRQAARAQGDEVAARVLAWKEGKQGNVRALLSSLHSVVWPSCRWQPLAMSQLVEVSDVRRHYLRACLAVHPDKVRLPPSFSRQLTPDSSLRRQLRGHQEERLATLVFVELNAAWADFEKSCCN